MNAREFHAIFKASGERHLSPAGWRYRKHSWHLEREEFYLALIPADTKYGMGLQIKYLTLTLVHAAVTCPSGEKPRPFENNDQFCPAQISPMRLKKYVETNCSDWVWHHVVPHRNRWTQNTAYEPLFYGGENNWVLAEKNASAWQNRWALRFLVKQFGATLLREREVEPRIERLVARCAEYGLTWAQHMTPSEVMRQLRHYGDGWQAPNWLNAYETAFPDTNRRRAPCGQKPNAALRVRNRIIGF